MITGPITQLAPAVPGATPPIVLPAGPAGQSAYELWLGQGNTGTVAQFLASLVGASADPTQLNNATGSAATSASNAAGSAKAAATSATTAAGSASDAAGSAKAAGQSVTDASTAASASAASAAGAAASVAQANRLASGTNFTAASTTSLTPALGTVALVLTAATAQGFAPSAFMAFVSASDWTASMQGQFAGYDPKTGTLTLAVFALGPNTAATLADWIVLPTPPPYLPTSVNGGTFSDPAPGTAVVPFTVAASGATGTPNGVNGGTF